ncbi:MAG: pseudouridine synthase [Hyphomicrobiaceae bacterium]|nr:pseudouridine synthase [Hyphomicrobiaceae bacterium]
MRKKGFGQRGDDDIRQSGDGRKSRTEAGGKAADGRRATTRTGASGRGGDARAKDKENEGAERKPTVKPQRRIEMRFPEARGELSGDTDERRGRTRAGPSKFNVRRDNDGPRDERKPPEDAPRIREPLPGSGRPIDEMRIAKALARSGLCSRREAERWIAEGRVQVNGETLASPALDVGPKDRVLVDGKPLPDAEPVRLWRYHKPRGLVTTHRDPEGRPTVFDNLPLHLGRVISIGRLDYNTEGLLLLTNDGALARHLELPTTGWLRRYRVRAHGMITQAQLDALKDGIEIDGVKYGPVEGTVDTVQGTNTWLTLGLREGKNREVRNILSSLNLTVNRLIRISYGPFQLLDLEEAGVESVKRRVLTEQLGPVLSLELGVERPDTEAAPQRSHKSKPRPQAADRGDHGDRPRGAKPARRDDRPKRRP